ncbi:MAG: hypothetical protein QXW00_01005 [Candidatus Woesearchaeota archaeon]
MKNAKWAIFLWLILIAPIIVRADFNIRVNPIKNVINVYAETPESAKFEVIIENKLPQQDRFTLSFSKDLSWIIRTEELSDYFTGIIIPGLQERTTTINVEPAKLWPAGTYNIVISVRSENTGIEKQVSLPINIQTPTAGDIIRLDAQVPESIDPRIGGEFSVIIESKIPIKRNNLKLKVTDTAGIILFEKEVSMDPLSKITVKVPVSMDPLQNPGEDSLQISVYDENGNLLKEISKTFRIEGYSLISEREDTTSFLLKRVTIITVSNAGNAPGTKLITKKVGFFQNLFLRTSPKAKWVKVGSQKLIGWNVEVQPRSEQKITMTTNYRGIALLLIAIAGLIAAYYYLKPPVEMTKKAKVIVQEEGGIAELKVLINIKNRGKNSIHNLRVVDIVPDIADVEDNFQAGTIKPDNITKNIASGTLIKWNIERMEPYDERLISYKIKSRLAIVGSFRLKPAVARYTINNKEYKAVSNEVWIRSRKEESE